jgi:GNAT superfamily N-acetyltransferase
MDYTLVQLTDAYLEPAIELFVSNYRQEQAKSSLLPSCVAEHPDEIRRALQSCLTNPGVAIVHQNQMLAYMVTGGQFSWKGQQAAIVPEYGHSAVLTNRQELYQHMYMQLAQEWIESHIHLHLIGYFAHDEIVQETMYQLGFGALVTERLRDLSDVGGYPDVVIDEERDVHKLIALHREHSRYYIQSPIFLLKPVEDSALREELEAHMQRGDVIFGYSENQELCAYMIVGQSTLDAEGFLLQNTNTAQIKSIYVQPDIRAKGIGKAFLQRAVEWSRQHGYERLFAEHEAANFYGGTFWRKHFTPYVNFSMRYIDVAI